MPDELTDRVLRVIAATQRIPIETVTLEKTFEDLGIDSMDGINILFALESEFALGRVTRDIVPRQVFAGDGPVDAIRNVESVEAPSPPVAGVPDGLFNTTTTPGVEGHRIAEHARLISCEPILVCTYMRRVVLIDKAAG